MVVEVFSGKSNLSKIFRRLGFQVASIDHKAVKNTPILILDLTNDRQVRLLFDLIDRGVILYVHFAPPCGTCSAARMIRLHKGRHGPPPLRSLHRPMGLKFLTKVQRQRVNQANKLYEITCALVLHLHSRGIAWSIENPASSLIWLTNPFVRLAATLRQELLGCWFHTCMYSAPRRKATALWYNFAELNKLAIACDDSHTHLAWGLTADNTFATADECAYNHDLCQHWAACVVRYAQRCGLTPGPETLEDITSSDGALRDKANQAIAGTQPRGSKLPPLLTDFLQSTWLSPADLPALHGLLPGSRIPDNEVLPKGTRVLTIGKSTGGVESSNKDADEFFRVGIPVEPLKYLEFAKQLVHPVNMDSTLSDEVECAVQLHMKGSVEVRRQRLQWARWLAELARKTSGQEIDAQRQRPERLQQIYRKKRFLLLDACLSEVGYPDSKIALEASAGFPLVGWCPASGVFEKKMRIPELHVSELGCMVDSVTRRTLSAIKPSGDELLDAEVWRITKEEAQAGFITEPVSAENLPADSCVSPRFGIKQGQKVRPIDNFSASLVNSTVGLPERLEVESIDAVVALVRRVMKLEGCRCELVGRTYDLKKAYRQLGVHPEHLRYSWAAVWDDEAHEPKVFQLRSLPFGAAASVAAFLRLSRALRFLGSLKAGLMWSSYFDDFVIVSRPEDVASTEIAVGLFFDSLGWGLSQDPEKDVGFSKQFSALGVTFDLTRCSEGLLMVGNTEKRKAELGAAVAAILDKGRLGVKESESLRSRLNFAESQVFGRSARLALKAIGEPAVAMVDMSPLSDEVIFGLRWMQERIVKAGPRQVSCWPKETFLLFFDGACEPGPGGGLPLTSIGGVLFGPDGTAHSCFGRQVPEDVVTAWSANGRQQLVFEAEVLPYAIGLCLWEEELSGRLGLVFFDNEGSRHCWIAGTADSVHARRIIHGGTLHEAKIFFTPFFCRVPTHSNIADGPSRLDFSLCRKLGARVLDVSDDLVRRCAFSNLKLTSLSPAPGGEI